MKSHHQYLNQIYFLNQVLYLHSGHNQTTNILLDAETEDPLYQSRTEYTNLERYFHFIFFKFYYISVYIFEFSLMSGINLHQSLCHQIASIDHFWKSKYNRLCIEVHHQCCLEYPPSSKLVLGMCYVQEDGLQGQNDSIYHPKIYECITYSIIF